MTHAAPEPYELPPHLRDPRLTPTEGDRVDPHGAARTQITLTDGTSPGLVFDFRALRQVEREFGSLGAALGALGATTGDTTGDVPAVELLDRPIYTTILGLVAAALSWTRAPRYTDPDALADLLDPARMPEYAEAISAAFEVAMPTSDGPDADPPDHPLFRGRTSTTPPPWSSDGVIGTGGV